MSNNNKQSQLFSLVELLYVPMAFYVLVQFDKIDSPLQCGLWLVIFALVQNEYLSIKESGPKYNIWLYLSDIISLFVYLFALKAIFMPQAGIGYNPWFWIHLSILWLSYAVWDWIMIYHEQNPNNKDDLRRWRSGMVVCFFITILCGSSLIIIVKLPTSPPIAYITTILQVMLFGCVGWALVGWWLRDYYFIKSNIEQAGNGSDVV